MDLDKESMSISSSIALIVNKTDMYNRLIYLPYLTSEETELKRQNGLPYLLADKV